MKKCLNFAWCGNYLSGKQRKWCSEACRKQASRRRQKTVRESRRLSANRPGSPGRRVQMRLIIDSDGLYPHLYGSRNRLLLAIQHVASSQKVKKCIETELERQIPGYMFEVVILSGG